MQLSFLSRTTSSRTLSKTDQAMSSDQQFLVGGRIHTYGVFRISSTLTVGRDWPPRFAAACVIRGFELCNGKRYSDSEPVVGFPAIVVGEYPIPARPRADDFHRLAKPATGLAAGVDGVRHCADHFSTLCLPARPCFFFGPAAQFRMSS